MLAVIVIILSLVLLLIREYFKHKAFNKLYSKLPAPPSVPILGHFFLIKNRQNFMERISKVLKDFDGFVAIHAGPWVKTVLVSDHCLINLLSTTHKVRKSNIYKMFNNLLGTNLFSAEGTQWKKYRKFLTPVFHLDILRQFIDPFNSVSTSLIKELKNKTDKPLDIFHFVELWALDAIIESAMTVSVNALKDPENKLVRNLQEECRILESRLFTPLKLIDFFYWFSRDFWKERAIIKYLENYTNLILREKMKARSEKKLSFEDFKIENNKKSKLAFLDLLLENRGIDITDEELCHHVELIMIAGIDTIANSVGYTLYLLSLHNEVQEKAFAEIGRICGDDKSTLCTFEDLQKMTYLDMVIKESLRLYPSAPMIGKYALEDIEYNGNTIPKGTDIVIFIYALHRSNKYFPNPLKFDPERFTPENQAKIIPYSYIPFSAGPRNCIGQKTAMLEMKVVLSTMLRNFKILPVEGFRVESFFSIFLKPGSDGIQVILQNREY